MYATGYTEPQGVWVAFTLDATFRDLSRTAIFTAGDKSSGSNAVVYVTGNLQTYDWKSHSVTVTYFVSSRFTENFHLLPALGTPIAIKVACAELEKDGTCEGS